MVVMEEVANSTLNLIGKVGLASLLALIVWHRIIPGVPNPPSTIGGI